MIVNITVLELKHVFKVITFFDWIKQIDAQLKNTNCLDYKKTGFWKTYYTVTSWQNKEDMQAFARNGAHLKTMQESRRIAKSFKTLSINADTLPNWKQAKSLLSKP